MKVISVTALGKKEQGLDVFYFFRCSARKSNEDIVKLAQKEAKKRGFIFERIFETREVQRRRLLEWIEYKLGA